MSPASAHLRRPTLRVPTRAPRATLFVALFVAGLVGACSSASVSGGASGSGSGGSTVLDGTNQSILVNGYSTSFAWPAMLQDMLDEHAGDRRVYHVLNSVIGGAPVESWIAESGSRDHERTVAAMDRDFFGAAPRLRGDAPPPAVAICQQSLQLTLDQRGPVKNEHDMHGAEIGADAMQRLAKLLFEREIQDIYIGMHIYKEPVEPEVGNERIALARLLSRGIDGIHAGPDTWELTRDAFPGAYDDDRLHPNEQGMKIMAEAWYRTLAGADAQEDVVARMWAREYDVDTMMREYLAWRRDG